MTIPYIVLYLSMFFWIFPAVKQYKTELFWYFLVYACRDPILSIRLFLHLPIEVAIYLQSFFSLLLLLSVLWPFWEKISARVLFAAALISVLITLFILPTATNYSEIFTALIITYYFILRTLAFVANTGKVNIFHLFLLLEEVSIVLKLLAVLIEIKTGTTFFIVTLAFEILIAIFFTLYREDDKRIMINLRKT